MSTQIRVPTAPELRERLAGTSRLLTAKKWERAAIVFAHTEVQTNKGSGNRPGVSPGKWNIRDFAAMGFAGLTTNKAVSRYRDAWITAINNGWAVPVEPGAFVNLPDQEFPAWPYGTEISSNVTITQMDNVESMDDYRSGFDYRESGGTRNPRRPVEERILEQLDKATTSLAGLTDALRIDELDDTMRTELVDKLTALQRQTREAIRALQGLVVV